MMNHTRMHKDIPVADLIIDEDSGFIDKWGAMHYEGRLSL